MLVVEKATIVKPGFVLLNCKSRNMVLLELKPNFDSGICVRQVLAQFCSAKNVELVVPHPDDSDGRLLISLISTFGLQVIAYEQNN